MTFNEVVQEEFDEANALYDVPITTKIYTELKEIDKDEVFNLMLEESFQSSQSFVLTIVQLSVVILIW